ncbi:MAG: hypothetical protein WCG26_05075 [Chloroflexales bacterium]
MGRALVAQEPTEAARAAFLSVAQELSEKYADWLDKQRKRSEKRATQPGILWDELVKNIIGQGSDAGLKRLNKSLGESVILGYETLLDIPVDQRPTTIEGTLRAAGVRWPAKKAPWIAENVAKMERRNGPENALKRFEEAPGRGGKIAFLRRFAGVGDKLARHIPMRLYHTDFRDSIAIDARIRNISELLGLRLRSFNDAERWYVAAAHEIGLDGWTLDRAMYHTYKEFIARLERAITAKEPA